MKVINMPSFLSKSNGPPRNHRHQQFASKCPPPYHRRRHHQHQHHRKGHRDFKPLPVFIPDQVIKDLRNRKPLSLLHRDRSHFFILDETTGTVINVQLSKTPSCSNSYYCYDRLCKHIKFVYMQVLGVPFNDVCLRKRSLCRSTIRRLINMPTLHESLSSFTLHLKFHEILYENTRDRVSTVIEMKDDVKCPVCLEEFGEEEKVVACDKCKNHVHKECFTGWKRKSLGRGLDVTCIFCRATWFTTHKEQHINLYGKDPSVVTDDEDDW